MAGVAPATFHSHLCSKCGEEFCCRLEPLLEVDDICPRCDYEEPEIGAAVDAATTRE